MKLIKLIKDLIKDKKNPRTLERIFVCLYLFSLEFVAFAIIGIIADVDAVIVLCVGAVVVFIIMHIITSVTNSIVALFTSTIAFVVAGVIAFAQTNPNLIIYLIIAEVIITIIAEKLCRKYYRRVK